MSEETERTKELVEEAYDLAERCKTLRAQIMELAKKSARIREATKKVRDDLDRIKKNPSKRFAHAVNKSGSLSPLIDRRSCWRF